MSLWFAAALLLRWRFQYSLRSLLLLVTVCAVACSWLAVTVQNGERQKRAAEAIRGAGGWVQDEPMWLEEFLPEDSVVEVTRVRLHEAQDIDAMLMHLQGLTQLQWLWLDNPKVTDAGLVHLRALCQLRHLDLANTQVTDAGLVHLEGLRQLEWLWLVNTKVSDAGLVHLRGLSRLRWLDLCNTRVTPEGAKRLQETLPDCTIVR